MSTSTLKHEKLRSSPSLEREALKSKDDRDVVLEHLAGNEYAFGELVRRYEKRLIAYAGARTWDTEEAEDVVQTTFLRVARHINKYDPERKFSTWIYEITKNLCLNVMRNRSRHEVWTFSSISQSEMNMVESRPVHSASFGQPDAILNRKDRDEEISEAVDQLPIHHRTTLRLWMKGTPYEAIAEEMGINIGTVKSRLHRARMGHLAKALSHLDPNKIV